MCYAIIMLCYNYVMLCVHILKLTEESGNIIYTKSSVYSFHKKYLYVDTSTYSIDVIY